PPAMASTARNRVCCAHQRTSRAGLAGVNPAWQQTLAPFSALPKQAAVRAFRMTSGHFCAKLLRSDPYQSRCGDHMDFSYTSEEEAFRLHAREWLKENAPRDIADRGFSLPTDPASIEALKDWQRKLFEAGFLGLSWPVEYGGQGKTIVYSAIMSEEMARARAPSALDLIGLSMAAPTILEHGTEEQRRRFVPRILSCEEIWCQGFSEPGSGSDLAALKSRAELAGDEFVVNGAKVWTSHGQIADWCMLLVRTEPDKPKHRGLSYLLVDMHSPGVSVRPLRQMTGEEEFN